MPNDSLLERVAEAIYDALREHDPVGKHTPWVPGGNSQQQDEARERAHRALVGATVYGAMTDDGEKQVVEAIFATDLAARGACDEYARRHTDAEGHAFDQAEITEFRINDACAWLPSGGAFVAEVEIATDDACTYWDPLGAPIKLTTRHDTHVTAYGRTAKQALEKAHAAAHRAVRG